MNPIQTRFPSISSATNQHFGSPQASLFQPLISSFPGIVKQLEALQEQEQLSLCFL